MIGHLLWKQAGHCSKVVSNSIRLQHHHACVIPSVKAQSIPSTASLLSLHCQTHHQEWMKPAKTALQNYQKQYILPSVRSQTVTILDPKLQQISGYKLPTYLDITQEKLTPPWKTIVPVEEPKPAHNVEQILMPIMVRIRHRKMKRHKFKKMRKRLSFLHRKLRELKRKKREKALKLYVSKWDKLADEFDAEKFAMERMSKAKEENWSVDLVKNWKKSKAGVNCETRQ